MNISEARQKVAMCWCDPRTSGRAMDPVLVEVMAEMLVDESDTLEKIRYAYQEYNSQLARREDGNIAGIRLIIHMESILNENPVPADDCLAGPKK